MREGRGRATSRGLSTEEEDQRAEKGQRRGRKDGMSFVRHVSKYVGWDIPMRNRSPRPRDRGSLGPAQSGERRRLLMSGGK